MSDLESAVRREAATASAPRWKSGIVWLASYPKSGNTWVRTFLHNLAKIKSGEAGPQCINTMQRYTVWDIAKPLYTEALGCEPAERHRDQIAALRPQVQQRLADSFEGLIFAKTHAALIINRGYPTINFSVTSGAVYIIRNPLDVAVSYAHHIGASIDHTIDLMGQRGTESGMAANAVYEAYGSWSENVLSWTRKTHPAIYIMRYEDMLADPAKAFGGLVRHLLQEASPVELTLAIERSSFERLQSQEEQMGFVEKPEAAQRFFREGRAGQWKDVLTTAQVRRIVREHGEQMRRFGYLPTD